MIDIRMQLLSKEIENGNNRITGNIQFTEESSTLILTPEEMKKRFGLAVDIDKVYGFNANILTSDNATLIIKGFNYLTIESYSNVQASFAYLKVYDATDFFRLNRLAIKRLDSENSNLLLADSYVDELNVGIESHSSKMRDQSTQISDIEWTDIRGSQVRQIRVFIPSKRVEIKDSKIEQLIQEGGAQCRDTLIWQGSNIDRLVMRSNIDNLQIRNSIISDIEFINNVVQKIDLKAAAINRIYGCNIDSVREKTLTVWKLIMDSARENDDATLYAEAGYEYMKCKQKEMKFGWQKMGYWLLQKTCGFGFKPSNTVKCAISIWLITATLFWTLTVFFKLGIGPDEKFAGASLFGSFGDALYYSTITFTTTGYGDITPISGIAKLCAGVEAVMGSTLMALFIFSLTKRYGSFK